ncbi:MAG: protease, partial [Bacteroidota bacterium]
MQFQKLLLLLGSTVLIGLLQPVSAQGFEGYYRYPTVHQGQIVFTAEGDLWKVPLEGGLAARLTSHLEEETHPHISPDGKTIAFRAAYEGSVDLYTMPIDGGLPERWTFGSESPIPSGWTPDGKVLYATRYYSTLPEYQLVQLDLGTKQRTRVPLYQASEGSYREDGKTVFFVRPADHRNVTKRYLGGTARKIWKYSDGADEAIRLSDDYAGESHHPMWWQGRVYFITDRDGTMNIWSMTESGEDLEQHTEHQEFDVRYATLSEGQIVYQRGADIWHLDLNSGAYAVVPITIVSDLDQRREKWESNPGQYLTSAHLHPAGKQVVLTARGRVFVAPVKSGRMVQLSRESGVRFRDATF